MRVRTADLLWARVGDEVVVLDQRTDMYLGINDTGAELWDLLVAGCGRRQLVERLVSQWEISEEQAGRDVTDFLQGLRAEALLDEDDADS
jgi:Coenzyme PQQ synthesis protein D (PqqD)